MLRRYAHTRFLPILTRQCSIKTPLRPPAVSLSVAVHPLWSNHNRNWSTETIPIKPKKKNPIEPKKNNVVIKPKQDNPIKPKMKKARWSTIQKQERASSGRIAFIDGGTKKSKSAMPKLCAGCGVEIVSEKGGGEEKQSSAKMSSGEEAVTQGFTRTKRQEKKSRYADVFSETPATALCNRCKSLQEGNVWKAYDALKDVDAKVFSSQLSHIISRRQFGLCIVVVDATDPEFSSVRKLRDTIRGTPCILAINKVDLLPRDMTRHDLNFLKSRVESGRTAKMIGAYGVSAQTGTGMIDLAEGMLEKIGGRDIFVVGSANVGKTTLVKSLSTLLARTLRMRGKNKRTDEKRKDVLQNLKVTASHLPGTTLQALRIPCFPSTRHAMWDTPGIINKSALAYSLFPSHLMEALAFPKPIYIPTEQAGTRVRVEVGHSILIEAGWITDELSDSSNEQRQYDENFAPFTLARLDIIEDSGMSVEALAFIPSCLRIRVVPTDRAPEVATIPKEYIAKIQNLVGEAGNFDDSDVSQPLNIFEGDGVGVMKDGTVHFDQMKDGALNGNGWIRKDIVFASLGWIMLNHRRSFSVRPWCVKESLWSKRRALYPSHLGDLERDGTRHEDETTGYEYMSDDNPIFENIKQRLRQAAEQGRHRADEEGKHYKRRTTKTNTDASEEVDYRDRDDWWEKHGSQDIASEEDMFSGDIIPEWDDWHEKYASRKTPAEEEGAWWL